MVREVCEILVLTDSELKAAVHRGDRLIEDLRRTLSR